MVDTKKIWSDGKRIKGALVLMLLLVCVSQHLHAQRIKINAGFLIGPTTVDYNFLAKEGEYVIEKRSGAIGVNFLLLFYPFKQNQNLFIEGGYRYLVVGANLEAINTVPSTVAGLNWGFRNRMNSFPIHIGYSVKPKWLGGGSVDLLGGVSYGITRFSFIGSGGFLERTLTDLDSYSVDLGVGMRDPNETKHRDLFTADVGFRYTPFARRPKWSIGCMLIYNMNSTASVNRDGHIANVTKGLSQRYYFDLNFNFVSYVFSVNYSFPKKAAKNERAIQQ